MHIVDIFTVLAVILTVLFMWFNTNVFYEYCKLFGLGRYFVSFEKQPSLTFPQYLFINKEKIAKNIQPCIFLIKLITCPVCLSFWLCMVGTVFLGNILFVFPLYVGTLFIYGLLIRLYP